VTLPRTSYPRFGPLGLAAPFQGACKETAAWGKGASHSAARNRPCGPWYLPLLLPRSPLFGRCIPHRPCFRPLTQGEGGREARAKKDAGHGCPLICSHCAHWRAPRRGSRKAGAARRPRFLAYPTETMGYAVSSRSTESTGYIDLSWMALFLVFLRVFHSGIQSHQNEPKRASAGIYEAYFFAHRPIRACDTVTARSNRPANSRTLATPHGHAPMKKKFSQCIR